jgi:hypothetical protein
VRYKSVLSNQIKSPQAVHPGSQQAAQPASRKPQACRIFIMLKAADQEKKRKRREKNETFMDNNDIYINIRRKLSSTCILPPQNSSTFTIFIRIADKHFFKNRFEIFFQQMYMYQFYFD